MICKYQKHVSLSKHYRKVSPLETFLDIFIHSQVDGIEFSSFFFSFYSIIFLLFLPRYTAIIILVYKLSRCLAAVIFLYSFKCVYPFISCIFLYFKCMIIIIKWCMHVHSIIVPYMSPINKSSISGDIMLFSSVLQECSLLRKIDTDDRCNNAKKIMFRIPGRKEWMISDI